MLITQFFAFSLQRVSDTSLKYQAVQGAGVAGSGSSGSLSQLIMQTSLVDHDCKVGIDTEPELAE